MAKIDFNQIHKIEKERSNVHKISKASYHVFIEENEKYFQIDTYGSDDRVFQEKVSQTIQFDRDSAMALVELLRKEFNF